MKVDWQRFSLSNAWMICKFYLDHFRDFAISRCAHDQDLHGKTKYEWAAKVVTCAYFQNIKLLGVTDQQLVKAHQKIGDMRGVLVADHFRFQS